jgi:hypothetical protein
MKLRSCPAQGVRGSLRLLTAAALLSADVCDSLHHPSPLIEIAVLKLRQLRDRMTHTPAAERQPPAASAALLKAMTHSRWRTSLTPEGVCCRVTARGGAAHIYTTGCGNTPETPPVK